MDRTTLGEVEWDRNTLFKIVTTLKKGLVYNSPIGYEGEPLMDISIGSTKKFTQNAHI
jgi:hypothetical protein